MPKVYEYLVLTYNQDPLSFNSPNIQVTEISEEGI
jgi:hypothetical protein